MIKNYVMRRLLLICLVAISLGSQTGHAQNIFDPNDPIVSYDPLKPPAVPAANTLAKWVRTKVYSWNTDKFKAYYFNGMAFRLRYPDGYNPADQTKKYPVIVFYHGGGEVAPNTDNESQLLYTGEKFQNMADAGQFNSFLLYPVHWEDGIWEDTHFTKVNQILDSMQKYCNLDPDRILTMGLSMGGFASIRYSAWYPQRSCLSISSSPALIETLPDNDQNKLVHIPMWVGNGGQDLNPNPSYVTAFVNTMTSKGATIRHSFYPSIGHLVWFSQFEEPYLLPYMTNAHKANPVVLYQQNQFDQSSSISARLGLSAGFYAYEWQKDNVTVATSTSGVSKIADTLVVHSFTGNEITVAAYGKYRARFKRTATSNWSDWSPNPVDVYRGLKYKYFEGAWNNLPDFNVMTPVATGTSPNVDIDSRSVLTSSQYAMIWEGRINLPAAGTYTFETVSDDGSKLYFNTPYSANATATVNNDGAHGAISATGTVTVTTPGTYPIAITYLQNLGNSTMQVYWSGPGFTRQLIPNSAFTSTGTMGDDVPPNAPANLKYAYNGRTAIDLTWNKATDNVGVVSYDVYVNGTLRTSTSDTSITLDPILPNVANTYAVKALDKKGNVSPFSNTITVTSTANGLQYKFYQGAWYSLPDFTKLTPVKKGTTSNVDLGVRPAGVQNNYAFLWEGYINIRTPGTYTFETVSDDGSKFYFNTPYSSTAKALVSNDGEHGAVSVKGTVTNLAVGVYPVAIAYNQITGGASMQLYWTGPTFGRQLVPDFAFVENVSDNTPPTTPSNFKANYVGRTFADLSWDSSSDNIAVSQYYVYANSVFQFATTSTSVTVDSLKPNTNYYFEVKAYDAAGNYSSSAFTQSLSTSANGLRYKYYEGGWSALPDFSKLTPVKTGTTPNVDLTPKQIPDYFGFVWEGYINIKTAGTYTFETISDDGSKLYFNSFYSPTATPLINNDGVHPSKSVSASVYVATPGLYPIAMTFFDQQEADIMNVYWTGPNFGKQKIPNAAFTEYFNGFTETSFSTASGITGAAADVAADANAGKLLNAYPNPFSKDLRINFNNSAADNDIMVGIYDLAGRLVYNKHFGKLAPGANTLRIDLSGQTQVDVGTYIARLQVNGIPMKTWKLTKVRR